MRIALLSAEGVLTSTLVLLSIVPECWTLGDQLHELNESSNHLSTNSKGRWLKRNLPPPPPPVEDEVTPMLEPTVLRYWTKYERAISDGGDDVNKINKAAHKYSLLANRNTEAMRQLAVEYEERNIAVMTDMLLHLLKMQSALPKGYAWRRYGARLSRGETELLDAATFQCINQQAAGSYDRLKWTMAQHRAARLGRADLAYFDPFRAREKADHFDVLSRCQDEAYESNIRKRHRNEAKVQAIVNEDDELAQVVAKTYFDRYAHHKELYERNKERAKVARGKAQGWNAKADEIEGLREVPYEYRPFLPPSSPAHSSWSGFGSD